MMPDSIASNASARTGSCEGVETADNTENGSKRMSQQISMSPESDEYVLEMRPNGGDLLYRLHSRKTDGTILYVFISKIYV